MSTYKIYRSKTNNSKYAVHVCGKDTTEIVKDFMDFDSACAMIEALSATSTKEI